MKINGLYKIIRKCECGEENTSGISEQEATKMISVYRKLEIRWNELKQSDREKDRSYDSPVLTIYNHGGLFYVSPSFLPWAKYLMDVVRQSITSHEIARMGSNAQHVAYDKVICDVFLEDFFRDVVRGCCSEEEVSEELVGLIYKQIVEFVFHSRSQCEWNKFKSLRTD